MGYDASQSTGRSSSSSFGSSASHAYGGTLGEDGAYGRSLSTDGSERSAGAEGSYSVSFSGPLDYNELAVRVSESIQSEFIHAISHVI